MDLQALDRVLCVGEACLVSGMDLVQAESCVGLLRYRGGDSKEDGCGDLEHENRLCYVQESCVLGAIAH